MGLVAVTWLNCLRRHLPPKTRFFHTLKGPQSDQILMSPTLASLDLPDIWTPISSCHSIPAIHKSSEWWKSYGAETPELQLLAVKVLSLSCSASGCERNWSIFEHIHSKKRNKMEHQRLQDLVFIKYNQALVERFEIRDKIDPMEFNEINFHTEWLVGEMEKVGDDGEDLVHPNHDLTWSQVADASGANEPIIYTRRTTRQLEVGSTSQATTAPRATIAPRATMAPRAPIEQVVEDVVEVEDEESEEDVEEDEDEELEEYVEEDEDEELEEYFDDAT